jgi:hypothetical protein
MDIFGIVHQALIKTQMGRLRWEPTGDPYELVARIHTNEVEQWDYIFRINGMLSPELTLENAHGQVVMRARADDKDLPPGVADVVNELWKMIEIGGKSVDEAAFDALKTLNDL